jgi:hypothetical protein
MISVALLVCRSSGSVKITGSLTILAATLVVAGSLAIPGLCKDGAKDLFYKQQASPAVVLNNGLQYWIELNRGGQLSKVSNKFAFKSGDKIRFHVKANIDAFAYVMLREGSNGEQSVLFPDARFHDNNKFKASVDYPIPQDGFLAFDSSPGTEKLILLLSRQELDANKYLADKTKKHVTIAAVPDGAKDLIPGSVVLAYSDQDSAAHTKVPEKIPSGTPVPSNVFASASEQAVTTLVQTDPTQVLAVDLALLHEP